MKKERTPRQPKVWEALLALIVVIAVVVAAIRTKVGIQMGLAMGGCTAIVFALLMGNKWSDIQDTVKRVVGDSATTLLILLSVGMMVGIWIIGGTVPTLLYYGLKICSPNIIVPLAFVLCAITSLFTGTSFGSIATMGLALFGVGTSMGISAPLMAGAVCSGAFFGDKMSPLSDTTNVAADMSGTPLYDHIGSMMYTTVPATVICLVLYTVLGIRNASANADLSNIELILDTLGANFNISVVALVPAVLVLLTSALKVPAVPAMLGCTAVSGVFACLLQKISLSAMLGAAMNGFSSDTGVAMVDKILSRGGMTSMYSTVAIIILSATMGAVLEKSGVIDSLVNNVLLKAVHKPCGLILSTMVYCYSPATRSCPSFWVAVPSGLHTTAWGFSPRCCPVHWRIPAPSERRWYLGGPPVPICSRCWVLASHTFPTPSCATLCRCSPSCTLARAGSCGTRSR